MYRRSSALSKVLERPIYNQIWLPSHWVSPMTESPDLEAANLKRGKWDNRLLVSWAIKTQSLVGQLLPLTKVFIVSRHNPSIWCIAVASMYHVAQFV